MRTLPEKNLTMEGADLNYEDLGKLEQASEKVDPTPSNEPCSEYNIYSHLFCRELS